MEHWQQSKHVKHQGVISIPTGRIWMYERTSIIIVYAPCSARKVSNYDITTQCDGTGTRFTVNVRVRLETRRDEVWRGVAWRGDDNIHQIYQLARIRAWSAGRTCQRGKWTQTCERLKWNDRNLSYLSVPSRLPILSSVHLTYFVSDHVLILIS